MGLSSDEAVARLQDVVSTLAPALLPWTSLIGVALDLDIEPSEEVRLLEDRFRKVRLEDAVMGLLAAVLPNPTIIAVDDVHHIDDASNDLLARRADDIDDLPWLVCVSRREVDGGFHAPDGPATQRLELGPLDRRSTTSLVLAETDHQLFMPQQLETLVDRADGNPLFLLELASALRAGAEIDSLP